MPKRTPCCQCGTTERVALRSPDMDIKPIPICLVCWYELMNPVQHNDGGAP